MSSPRAVAQRSALTSSPSHWPLCAACSLLSAAVRCLCGDVESVRRVLPTVEVTDYRRLSVWKRWRFIVLGLPRLSAPLAAERRGQRIDTAAPVTPSSDEPSCLHCRPRLPL